LPEFKAVVSAECELRQPRNKHIQDESQNKIIKH
jgi:hypothetical protein